LLADALPRAARSKIASFAVIVQAKGDGSRRFYECEGFIPFENHPLKLFLWMADIRSLLE
jgi:hypothetical protein